MFGASVANKNPKIAAIPHGVLINEISALVDNRRKNMVDSKKLKKDGTPKKILQTIYETQKVFYVPCGAELIVLQKPTPLPLRESNCLLASASAVAQVSMQPKPPVSTRW